MQTSSIASTWEPARTCVDFSDLTTNFKDFFRIRPLEGFTWTQGLCSRSAECCRVRVASASSSQKTTLQTVATERVAVLVLSSYFGVHAKKEHATFFDGVMCKNAGAHGGFFGSESMSETPKQGSVLMDVEPNALHAVGERAILEHPTWQRSLCHCACTWMANSGNVCARTSRQVQSTHLPHGRQVHGRLRVALLPDHSVVDSPCCDLRNPIGPIAEFWE